MSTLIEPMAILHSPFHDKFAVPRQPGLVPAARGYLQLLPPFDRDEALKGIEQYSHLWLIFHFHLVAEDKARQPTVRPPRLGGNERIGVFASRSPFRPNRLGLSVVRLEGVDHRDGKPGLLLSGVDLVDGTPIFDIKPYLPYVDQVTEASAGQFARPPAQTRKVRFDPEALEQLARYQADHPELIELITQTLALDPRPGYRQGENGGEFGMTLYDVNIRWREEETGPLVINATRARQSFRGSLLHGV